MIHVNRGPQPNIPVYTEKNRISPKDSETMVSRAQEETERAINYYGCRNNFDNNKKLTEEKFSPDFKVYSNKKLREELETRFNNKCAYCESRVKHVTPFDVEHFRPKKKIHTGKNEIEPGYYWLAAKWENLLVSCPMCNRRNELEIAKQIKKVTQGKHTQFPLSEGKEDDRVRRHNIDISPEEPFRLLIDPCLENPEDFFTYDQEGLILIREEISAHESNKAEKSRDVYALQRKVLVEEREATLRNFKNRIDELSHNINELNRDRIIREALLSAGAEEALEANKESMEATEEQIKKVVRELNDLTSPKSCYIGMLRDYIRKMKALGEFDVFQGILDIEDLLN